MLLPNTGDEATEDGNTWGFHGEAGLRAWRVVATTPDSLELVLDLDTAPLAVRRAYRVDGPALTVETTVHNVSPRSVEFLWGEHPTFGEAFAPGAVLEIDAETFHVETADREIGLNAGDTIRWPGRAELAGASLDHIPVPSSRRFLFGFLDGVREGTYRLRNDRLGLAARLSWPREVFPVVWLWEEIRFTDDPPWNGQAYAVGIEPHVAYPAVGMTELRRRGGHGLILEPGASLAGTVTLSVERIDVGA
jgi:galactose mutarotase-like enzyme